jgi:predicted TIM-barrel fold metal-dependent hydrolase
MSKNGFRIFDADTHVGPAVNIIDNHLSQAEKRRLDSWEDFKWVDARNGNVEYTRYRLNYMRKLGSKEFMPAPDQGRASRFTGELKHHPALPTSETDPDVRIRDMDLEGVDVNLCLPSSWFGTFCANEDVELEHAMYRAYHRWMKEYCGAYPARLKGVIAVSARNIPESVKELERCAQEDWPLAAHIYVPTEMPIDDPDLEPIWAACQHNDLSIALHSFTRTPPYGPGAMDVLDNHFLLRCAVQPWSGERDTAAFIGAGIMDRYPNLRIAPLESGHGWLPFWMVRMDENARSHKKWLPADLKMKPSDYVRSGRYFQSIEMSEGEKLTKAVIDFVGEDVLMYASDYPHAESWYPHSVETVMAWDMPETMKRKLFWDNAVKFYARYPAN